MAECGGNGRGTHCVWYFTRPRRLERARHARRIFTDLKRCVDYWLCPSISANSRHVAFGYYHDSCAVFGHVARSCGSFLIFVVDSGYCCRWLTLYPRVSAKRHHTSWGTLLVGFVVAVVSTYACIHYFLAFIRRIGMQPFVIYRIILGLLLLAVVW